MEANEILVIAMFLSFIALLFTGIPVAWVLGGIGIVFAFLGQFTDSYMDTMTGLDYTTLGLVVNRLWTIMENWILGSTPHVYIYGDHAR